MLDFLLVLGRIPGTGFQITYNELVLVFMASASIYEYRLRRRAIRRWAKWAWYRLGVNYRKRKRQLKSFIKLKRHRLALAQRRAKRQVKSYIRQAQRAALRVVYRRYSRVKRQYYIKIVQLERTQRRFKNFVSQSG